MKRRKRKKRCAHLNCYARDVRGRGLCTGHHDTLRRRADMALALQDAKIVPELLRQDGRNLSLLNAAWSVTRERRAIRAAFQLGYIGPIRDAE